MKRNHDRKPENTKISISLPKDLLATVEALAQSEQRSRSKMISLLLEKEIKHHNPQPIIAEESPEYKIKKTTSFKIELPEEMDEMIEKRCQELGITPAAYFKILLEAKTPADLPPPSKAQQAPEPTAKH